MRIIDESQQRLAHQFVRAVTQQQLRGFIAAFDPAVRGGDEHRVAQAVEHGVQIILGDRGFVEILPHALERELQISKLIAAHYRQRPGVVAVADPIRAFHQRRNGAGQLAGDEPGADQPQDDQRQGDAGEHPADAFNLDALLAQQLRVDAGEGLLHLRPAHPYLETAETLHIRAQHIRAGGGRARVGVVARIQ